MALVAAISLTALVPIPLLSRAGIELFDQTQRSLAATEEIANLIAENRIAEAYMILSNGT